MIEVINGGEKLCVVNFLMCQMNLTMLQAIIMACTAKRVGLGGAHPSPSESGVIYERRDVLSSELYRAQSSNM